MEKTQKILKKFISLILTFAISFGSYVFPVFAALPEDNEAPTIEEVVDAYDDLKEQKKKVVQKMDEITNSIQGVSAAKTTALDEAENYLKELDRTFNNDSLNQEEHETLVVKTTEYNVITVIVDFKPTAINLGITLTNETMKEQVLEDTYKLLQEHCYGLEFVYLYLAQSEDYTILINNAGEKIENVSQYIEKLEELNITYDEDMYEAYVEELAILMIEDDELQENIDNITNLSTELMTYTSSIKEILRKGLLDKYTELKDLATNSTISGMDVIATFAENAILSLEADTYNLLSNDYETQLNNYNNLIIDDEKTNNPEKYIETKINEINETLKETFNLNITVEQIELIESLLNASPSEPTSVEDLVSKMDADDLSEKLISGELSYEILEAYAKVINNHDEVLDQIENLNIDLSSSTAEINDAIENDIFGSNGGYMEELNNVKNESKTDEERLQILNKLDLMDKYLDKIKNDILPATADEEETITPITEKIEELREFYNKSADNKLTGLTVNGIEMDVTQETYKVYVGNDVTELTVVFEKSNPNAKVEILNGKDLKVGTNEVIVLVTAENGEVREYKLEVIRAEAKPVVTTENKDTDEAIVKPLVNNTTSNETVEEDKEEHKNTSDSNEKYNEEVEEKEGLSFFTVLLIVAGIAAVAYGVYKIFGEKEDQKIEKAFEQPKVNQNKPSPSKKKKQKKRK